MQALLKPLCHLCYCPDGKESHMAKPRPEWKNISTGSGDREQIVFQCRLLTIESEVMFIKHLLCARDCARGVPLNLS